MVGLRHGDWREVLAEVEVDALIADPPYGKRTHTGHEAGAREGRDGSNRQALPYEFWTEVNVDEFVGSWSPRVRGWMVALTSHDLIPAWQAAYEAVGRYSFAPVSCVVSGSRVRLVGDGPSNWTVYAMVARPRTSEFVRWGTLPGAYIVRRGSGDNASKIVGGKPLELMLGLVRDYSKAGDIVCDPCAGMGTTLRAAEQLGRSGVGAEIDLGTYDRAMLRLGRSSQIGLL